MDFKPAENVTEEYKISLFTNYAERLTGIIDDFWEMHILGAELFTILHESRSIGYFTVYDDEKLTSLFIENAYLYKAQDIFQRIISEYAVKTAFVATCDELFLSLCLDFHQAIEMQAYFFDGSVHQSRRAEYSRACFSEINPEELGAVNDETEGFFADAELTSRRCVIYRLTDNGETLGYGVVVPVKTRPIVWGCGMVTLPKHRCKGVGRSIQIHLADICRENGKTPISGCWYHNHLSKKTIESAGRYTKTRLLNVHFAEKANFA